MVNIAELPDCLQSHVVAQRKGSYIFCLYMSLYGEGKFPFAFFRFSFEFSFEYFPLNISPMKSTKGITIAANATPLHVFLWRWVA